MLVDIVFPLNPLWIKYRPYNLIDFGYKLPAKFLGVDLTRSMVEVEKDGVGRILSSTIEIALAILVEKDVYPEGGDAVGGVEFGDLLRQEGFLLSGEGVGGKFEGPAGHFGEMQKKSDSLFKRR